MEFVMLAAILYNNGFGMDVGYAASFGFGHGVTVVMQ
jgi:hypothetical protein